jgi:hypothetical protein
MLAPTRALLLILSFVLATSGLLTSCASKPKRRERQPPPSNDSTMPWNRPGRGEGNGRFGSMMPQSR